jgi:cyclic pyranopterin phosphate synthase
MTTTTEQTNDRFGRPLRDLRISVTDRCNFRCPYCMPAEVFGDAYKFMPRPELLTFEEIARLARIAASLGTTKLRLTGGEPLLRRDLPDLIELLADIEGIEDLALTTNGYLLSDNAERLAAAGLRRITVSLDSLDEEVFQELNGRQYSVGPVLEGIDAARRAGLSPIKINCVVIDGVNDHTIGELAGYFRGTGHIVRFIEYMDVGTLNDWKVDEVVSAKEIVKRIGEQHPLVPLDASYRGEVARRYAYRDGSGEIGVIASVTAPFCGDCTRARLSSDGRLVTCLFAESGSDLKTPLRDGADDSELRRIMSGIWAGREDRYSEVRFEKEHGKASKDGKKIQMYEIGG